VRSDPLLHDFLVLLSVRDTILGAKRDTIEVAVGAKLPQDWLRGSLWDAKSKARCSSMLCLPINGLRWSVSLLLIRQSDNVVNSMSDEVG
jgi:hypothetical protein